MYAKSQCKNNPCKNGGNRTNLNANYTCTYSIGIAGKYCKNVDTSTGFKLSGTYNISTARLT